MANLRHTQHFRNQSVHYYADYATAVREVKLAFESNKNNLKDGELILGRYGFPGNDTTPSQGETITNGVVVGVARRSGNDVHLDFLADENYVSYIVGSAVAQMNLDPTTVGVLENSSATVSTLTLYNVEQNNGQVSVGTVSNTLQILMAGKYNEGSNRVALESTVTKAVSGIASSQALLTKTNSNKTYTFGTLITQIDGVNSVTGSESLTFKSEPTSNNPIITESDLSGIVGGMYYKGTVDATHPLPESGMDAGWVYIVAADGTYGGYPCEVGDMLIYNGSGWNAVSGENQVETDDTTIGVGDGNQPFTIIGTVDGTPVKIRVVDTYSRLVGTADADDVQNPTTGNGQVKVLNRIEEANGVISAVTAYVLSTVASTGNASDVAFTPGTLISTNVQAAIEELSGSIAVGETTINSLHGNFTIGSGMLAVDDNNRVIGLHINPPYLQINEDNSVGLAHVDIGGGSTIGTDLATVNTVTTYITSEISALDGTVDADAMTGDNLTTPTADFKVLNSVVEEDGIITFGTAYNLKKLAATGAAGDVSVLDSADHFTSANVEGALAELAVRIGSVAGTDIQAGNGVTVSSASADGVKTYEVAVELGSASVVGTSTEYNSSAENLLVIATDGKLSISDSWDCGTY